MTGLTTREVLAMGVEMMKHSWYDPGCPVCFPCQVNALVNP